MERLLEARLSSRVGSAARRYVRTFLIGRSPLSHPARPLAAGAALAVVVSMFGFAAPASASAGSVVIASASDSGVVGNETSEWASLSADGSVVAFSSRASNLDPADSDATDDIYVKNLTTGNVVLASTSDAGEKSNGKSERPWLSSNGRSVAFFSTATNLDPGDHDANPDVYVKNLLTGNITLASTSDAGIKGDGASYYPSLSGDGTRVSFSSVATNLDPGDTDPVTDTYVKNLTTGNLTLASTSDTGVKGNAESSVLSALSSDGVSVAFSTRANNLDPGDTDTTAGFLWDVYVKNLTSGNIILASTSDTGVKGNQSSMFPSLSSNGNKVAFGSGATNLDPAATRPNLQNVYVKSLTSGDIVLASITAAGVSNDGFNERPVLSGNGNSVAFTVYDSGFEPRDNDSSPDTYVKNLTTGALVLASVSATGIKGNGPSDVGALSSDGSMFAFASASTNLAPNTVGWFEVFVKDLSPSGPPPTTSLSIGNRSIVEGDVGSKAASFKVTVSAVSPTAVTVAYSTSNGTAHAGSDYTALSGTLTIPAGQTSGTIVVRVTGDRIVEPRETYTLTLLNPVGATLADAQGAGTIGNND